MTTNRTDIAHFARMMKNPCSTTGESWLDSYAEIDARMTKYNTCRMFTTELDHAILEAVISHLHGEEILVGDERFANYRADLNR